MAPLSDSELSPLHGVLLQHILSFEDQYSILAAASVNREFQMAAAVALSTVDLSASSSRTFSHFDGYLEHHQSNLTSLAISGRREDDCPDTCRYVELPALLPLRDLSNLEELVLAKLTLQLGPSSTGSETGVLSSVAAAVATRLTLLDISDCYLLDGQEGLSVVSTLKSLKHLHLGPAHPTPRDQAISTMCTFPGGLLSVLVQLTHLSIGLKVTSSSLQHLSCLTALRELRLPYDDDCSFHPADLAELQHTQQLTLLELNGASDLNDGFERLTQVAALWT